MTDFEEAQLRHGLRAGAIPLSYRIKTALGITPAIYGDPIPIDKRRKGFDLSHWNSTVNHQTAVNAGIQFGYFRATLGTTYPDDQYSNNRTNAGNRYPWGSYHALTTAAGSSQAQWFWSKAKDNPGKLPLLLDAEIIMAASIIKSCVLQLYTLTGGQYPLIYTSAYKWSLITDDPVNSNKTWISNHCPLIVAHWGTDSPILPPGWATYAVHQYSADNNGLGVTYGAPPPPAADADMDLDRTSAGWLGQFLPPSDIESRVTALEGRMTDLEQRVTNLETG